MDERSSMIDDPYLALYSVLSRALDTYDGPPVVAVVATKDDYLRL